MIPDLNPDQNIYLDPQLKSRIMNCSWSIIVNIDLDPNQYLDFDPDLNIYFDPDQNIDFVSDLNKDFDPN